jgi:hypothetical protein
MEAFVDFYDIESDKAITKHCIDFSFNQGENYFSFTPFDEGDKIYKSIAVDSTIVKFRYSMYGLKIIVKGWMMVKGIGYCRNEVIIRILK